MDAIPFLRKYEIHVPVYGPVKKASTTVDHYGLIVEKRGQHTDERGLNETYIWSNTVQQKGGILVLSRETRAFDETFLGQWYLFRVGPNEKICYLAPSPLEVPLLCPTISRLTAPFLFVRVMFPVNECVLEEGNPEASQFRWTMKSQFANETDRGFRKLWSPECNAVFMDSDMFYMIRKRQAQGRPILPGLLYCVYVSFNGLGAGVYFEEFVYDGGPEVVWTIDRQPFEQLGMEVAEDQTPIRRCPLYTKAFNEKLWQRAETTLLKMKEEQGVKPWTLTVAPKWSLDAVKVNEKGLFSESRQKAFLARSKSGFGFGQRPLVPNIDLSQNKTPVQKGFSLRRAIAQAKCETSSTSSSSSVNANTNGSVADTSKLSELKTANDNRFCKPNIETAAPFFGRREQASAVHSDSSSSKRTQSQRFSLVEKNENGFASTKHFATSNNNFVESKSLNSFGTNGFVQHREDTTLSSRFQLAASRPPEARTTSVAHGFSLSKIKNNIEKEESEKKERLERRRRKLKYKTLPIPETVEEIEAFDRELARKRYDLLAEDLERMKLENASATPEMKKSESKRVENEDDEVLQRPAPTQNGWLEAEIRARHKIEELRQETMLNGFRSSFNERDQRERVDVGNMEMGRTRKFEVADCEDSDDSVPPPPPMGWIEHHRIETERKRRLEEEMRRRRFKC